MGPDESRLENPGAPNAVRKIQSPPRVLSIYRLFTQHYDYFLFGIPGKPPAMIANVDWNTYGQ